MSTRVLIIDDDQRLVELVKSYLGQNGVEATAAPDGRSGLQRLGRDAFDAVLLDIMMPGGLDGLSVLRTIRDMSSIPVLMLTAKGDETDRVVGLELGADDYLPKPFSPRELLARLRAVLRRTQPDLTRERLSTGGIVAEVGSRSVEVEGQPVELTGIEFDLLVALMRRSGRVVPRASLLAEAGRQDVTVSDRTVDVHISHLRKKLGASGARLLQTVRGVGYVFARESI